MLEQYQTEIIALVAVLLVTVLYIFIKKKQKIQKIDVTQEEVVQDPYDTASERAENKQQQPKEELSQTPSAQEKETIIQTEETEPNFNNEYEDGFFKQEEDFFEQNPIPSNAKITKREVPPHGKIHKENFKEFAGERILLAEDNLINQKVILGLLADSGIEVVVANDGLEALNILEKDDNFLLVLMDAHMPNMDGFEATREIRKNPKYDHILVVALSGDTAADDIKKMTEAGMSEHLEKPLKIDALYDIIYAYSGAQKEKNAEIEVLISTSLDTTEGLAICGGDDQFYREILNEFLESYKNSTEVLQAALQNKRHEEAAKILLDIIGVSANIGAAELNKTATALRNAIEQRDSNIGPLFSEFSANLKNLVKDIYSYLS